MKDSPELSIIFDYQKRIGSVVHIKEIKPSTKTTEAQEILKTLLVNSFIIALDERGDNLTSLFFADLLAKAALNQGHLTLIIGGAEGLDDTVRNRAHKLISFGHVTWPHKLVRVMAMEQIYRAMTILSKHPYHREG